MPHEIMNYSAYFPEVMKQLRGAGLLLGSYAPDGKANLMTIGWGELGSIWAISTWTVLVRHSRYTFECIEHSGAFTIAVPTSDLAGACGVCGTQSGRDVDKFAECQLTEAKAQHVNAPYPAECPIIYECNVVQATDMDPDRLNDEIAGQFYGNGDFHRIYFGEIVASRVNTGLVSRIG